MLESSEIDLGHDHGARFYGWHPDRDLNPQFADLPDVVRAGLLVSHPDLKVPGQRCCSGIAFEGTAFVGQRQAWTLESDDPLTVSPSLLCMRCGDHGFIRGGRWVPV